MEIPLECRDVRDIKGVEVLEALLACPRCHTTYPIREGLANLIPPSSSLAGPRVSRYEAPSMISSYLWAHYADITGDQEANHHVYEMWASVIHEGAGFALDAGCAVGRLTFELSRRADYSVGVDASLGLIKKARELMSNRAVRFTLPEEGLLHRIEEIQLPNHIKTNNVEFLLADVERLPFSSSQFGAVASLNILDKVSHPLKHLQEIDRVSVDVGAQLLFSDPFSWSPEVTDPENWLGGKKEGSFKGRGYDNVVNLVGGRIRGLKKNWRIEEKGQLWWKIRNHANHFELIRSLYFTAVSTGTS